MPRKTDAPNLIAVAMLDRAGGLYCRAIKKWAIHHSK